MTNWHCDFIEVLLKQLKPSIYVELGVCGAVTLNRSLPLVGTAYACDLVSFDNFLNSSPSNLHKHIMSTEQFAQKWSDEIRLPIDFIFIDADHSKESVWKDIQNFLPWLKADSGLMILHDMWPPSEAFTSHRHCGDAYKINSLLRNLAGIEYTVLPIQFGIGIIRKVETDWRN